MMGFPTGPALHPPGLACQKQGHTALQWAVTPRPVLTETSASMVGRPLQPCQFWSMPGWWVWPQKHSHRFLLNDVGASVKSEKVTFVVSNKLLSSWFQSMLAYNRLKTVSSCKQCCFALTSIRNGKPNTIAHVKITIYKNLISTAVTHVSLCLQSTKDWSNRHLLPNS